ncbi:MAG: hypothetical protein QM648_11160 [Solirubrobacterales bacterium]
MVTISVTFAALRERLRSEEGISMIAAMMSLVVGISLGAAAWATAGASIARTSQDRYGKAAYQIAQSGVSDFVQRLGNDPNFWQACDRAGLDKNATDANTRAGLGLSALNDTLYGTAYDTAYGVTQGGGHPERRWLPWSTAASATDRAYTAQYTIDLLPANGYSSCATAGFTGDVAAGRLVNNVTGTFRIRVTGRAGPPPAANYTTAAEIADWRAKKWKKVSIVTEFRRAGFLDYAYFTDHEAIDPNISTANEQTFLGLMATLFSGAGNYDFSTKCSDYYRHDPTSPTTVRGREGVQANGYECPNERPLYNGESINGPAHTNDSIRVESTGSSGPIFGNANKGDRIEVYDRGNSGSTCTGNNFTGACACPFHIDNTNADSNSLASRSCSKTVRTNTAVTLVTGPDAGYIDMPTGNSDLKTWAGDAAPTGYLFAGPTKIVLNSDSTVTITNAGVNGGVAKNYAYPANGVIYVQNNGTGSCDSDPNADYTSTTAPGGMDPNCARIELSGTYNVPLTIGSESDIVITGNVNRASGTYALLGLVAQNYIRIRHYPTSSSDLNRQSICSMTDSFSFSQFSDYANCISANVNSFFDILSLFTNLISALWNSLTGNTVATPTCVHETGNTYNGTTPVTNITAAMVALRRSVTLDSSQCGDQIASTLNFNGAVTQNWRGGLTNQDWRASNAVVCGGTSGWWQQFVGWIYNAIGLCGGTSGYSAKTFNYDYLLRALSPPHFLTPTESAWRINRIRQTVPACNCGPTGS